MIVLMYPPRPQRVCDDKASQESTRRSDLECDESASQNPRVISECAFTVEVHKHGNQPGQEERQTEDVPTPRGEEALAVPPRHVAYAAMEL